MLCLNKKLCFFFVSSVYLALAVSYLLVTGTTGLFRFDDNDELKLFGARYGYTDRPMPTFNSGKIRIPDVSVYALKFAPSLTRMSSPLIIGMSSGRWCLHPIHLVHHEIDKATSERCGNCRSRQLPVSQSERRMLYAR